MSTPADAEAAVAGQPGAPRSARFRDAAGECCDHGQVPDDALTWPEVSSRLAAARNYWLGTTTPSGAPHAAPVWGAATGGTLGRCSERSTVKARNIAADPAVGHVVATR